MTIATFAGENNNNEQWKGKNKSYSINQIKSYHNTVLSVAAIPILT